MSRLGSHFEDLNAPAVWAGITTFIWYAVGLVPVQIAVTGQFGLDANHVSSWIFIIWLTGSVSSIALSLVYRQPIPITSSIPGLVFLGTVAGRFSFPELVGANMLAGILIVVLGVTGVGGRVLRWLPMPLAMGMLAGSILGDVTRMVSATVSDIVVAGATVAGYCLGRVLRTQRIPPVGLAVLTGAGAVMLTGSSAPQPILWSLPTPTLTEMQFTFSSFIAVSIPLVVLSMVLGNVQGLGFLAAQGYKVPANATTWVLGLNSVVNAFFGGHPAIVSRNGMPIMAGPEAGPVGGRYWANLISAGLSITIALAAVPVASLLGILPAGYIIALAGLALLPSFQNAVEKAVGGNLRFGAVVAFVVAATPFSFLGFTPAFWALFAGIGASLLAERSELFAVWRGTPAASEQRQSPRLPVVISPSRADRVTGDHYSRVTATIMDLSAGGMRVRSAQQISTGDHLNFAFALPTGEAELWVRVYVRHAEHLQTEPVDMWEAGCEFRDVRESDRGHLVQFIMAHHSALHEAAVESAEPAQPVEPLRFPRRPRQAQAVPIQGRRRLALVPERRAA